jgi:hypothetical protein
MSTRRPLAAQADDLVGAVAWTTPVCWYTFFNGGSCNDTSQGTPCNNAPTSCPNGYAAVQKNLSDCIVVTNNYCKGTATPVTLTNTYCGNCKIVYAEAKTGSVCTYPSSPPNTNGNIAGGTNTVTFPQNLDPSGYSQFALLLSCT